MYYYSYNTKTKKFFSIKQGQPVPYVTRQSAERDVEWWNDHNESVGSTRCLIVVEVDLEAIAES